MIGAGTALLTRTCEYYAHWLDRVQNFPAKDPNYPTSCSLGNWAGRTPPKLVHRTDLGSGWFDKGPLIRNHLHAEPQVIGSNRIGQPTPRHPQIGRRQAVINRDFQSRQLLRPGRLIAPSHLTVR